MRHLLRGRLAAALLLATAALPACARSDLEGTLALDCGPGGARAVIAYAAVCVYPGGLPETCPEALPFSATDGTYFYCVGEPRPDPALLRAARASLVDAGATDGAVVDAVIGISPVPDGRTPDARSLDPRARDARAP